MLCWTACPTASPHRSHAGAISPHLTPKTEIDERGHVAHQPQFTAATDTVDIGHSHPPRPAVRSWEVFG